MYKIAEWNLNNATKEILIPDFVSEEIKNLDADIMIITEFVYCSKSASFLDKTFKACGYDYLITENFDKMNQQNDVIIAWKSDQFSMVDKFEKINKKFRTTFSSNTPNFLVVKLKETNYQGREFIVVGLRITMGDAVQKSQEKLRRSQDTVLNTSNDALVQENQEKLRRSQMVSVLEEINNITETDAYCSIIIGGDCNNYRRGYVSGLNESWDMPAFKDISQQKGYESYIPNGSSIYNESCFNKDYEFPEDRFVVKNCYVENYEYNRLFTHRNSDIYINGADFQVYDNDLKQIIWKIICGSGIPDHAILTGNFILEEKCENEQTE